MPKEHMSDMSDHKDAMRHDDSHRMSHHKAAYSRTYKTDEEEHQATEDLNRQYRGVPR